uniref:Cold regulated protein 27 n=1 Tax=Davidia involucrata TaxID=16924 RepID=A0A5B7ALE7_DAVIN
MEDNLRPEVQPASPDLAVTDGCRNELTPSNSVSSALTVENSKDMSHQNVNAIPGQCTTWTDEKHSLYLDSLEASFVHQLHHSMGLLAWSSDSSRQLPVNSRSSSDQFTVLRDGCWQKINFERNQPLLDAAADSHVFLDSPWIRHFRCAGKSRTIASADLQQHRTLCTKGAPLRGKRAFSHGLATSLEQLPVCHRCYQDSAGSITEVSDQNFVDEDQEEKLSSLSMAKRLKMAAANASSKDQIVPCEKFRITDISNVRNASSEREEQVHNEWPSEVESFICAKPDMKSFLRES